MIRRLSAVVTAALVVATFPALAKKNDPAIHLEFAGEPTVRGVPVHLPDPMLHKPARLRLEDGRPGDAPRSIGMRTDDNNQMTTLFATNDVVPYVAEVMRQALPGWGLLLRDDADLHLDAKLVKFRVTESNELVGASYNAEVRIKGELRKPDGELLWSGTATGATKLFGRKYSSHNVNEALGDAMLETFGALLRSPQLQYTWSHADPTETSASTSAAPAGAPVSPAGLLREVLRLMDQGFEAPTIESYVSRQKLTAMLTADDLAAWKNAAVPEPVIRAALELPVR